MNELHIQILPKKQAALLKHLQETDWLGDFYLGGGTALALQIGHRQSVDFYFFSEHNFNNPALTEKLLKTGKFTPLSESENTLYGILNDVRISFIAYKYKLLNKLMPTNRLLLAGMKDLACMKLSAAITRGQKKDFIDLYFLLKHFSLQEIIRFYETKYNQKNYSYIILKALLYFDDAEKDPMPKMIEKVSWNEVKNVITGAVKKHKIL